MNNNAKCILVTGGGGFIGFAIVRALITKGYKVRTLNRGTYKKLIELDVETIQGDIRDSKKVERAVNGINAVFHVASKTGYWGSEKTYHDINVIGTQNLLNVSKRHGVQKFIYTSTPSVIGYNNDVTNGKQNLPYPSSFLSPYSKTKAEAEQMVLNFNQEQIATIAIRPHLVFGPGDNNLLPVLLKKSIEGSLPRIGNKSIKVDFTYIDNVVEAHLCALNSLKAVDSVCAGKAYFISNNNPVDLWEWINTILNKLGYPSIKKITNRRVLYNYAQILEILWKTLSLNGQPPITRFLVNALSRSHWYCMDSAKKELNYKERVTMNEATTKTIEWLKKHHIK